MLPPADTTNRARGLTLVEVVVAVVVFGVGVLALGSAMLVIMRQARAAQIQSVATNVAASRLERLVFYSCGTHTAGSEQIRDVESSWSVHAPVGTGAMLITQDVRFVLPSGSGSTEYHSAVPCR